MNKDSKNLTCRFFEKDDWAAFRDIRLTALQTDSGVFASNYNREKDYDEAKWRDFVCSDTCRTAGIFEGGRPVAFMGIVTMAATRQVKVRFYGEPSFFRSIAGRGCRGKCIKP